VALDHLGALAATLGITPTDALQRAILTEFAVRAARAGGAKIMVVETDGRTAELRHQGDGG
jgi:hypothetical protein